MQLVTLKQDMRPWRAGDDVPLADDLARQLVDAGEAENMRPFGGEQPAMQDRAMRAGAGKQGYKVKGS